MTFEIHGAMDAMLTRIKGNWYDEISGHCVFVIGENLNIWE